MQFISSTLIALALSTLAVQHFAEPEPELPRSVRFSSSSNRKSEPNFPTTIDAVLAAPNTLEKKSEKCRIVSDGSRCRRSASTSADIIGQFAVGATPTFSCYTTGTTVDGSNIWDRTTITIGGSKVNCFVSDTLVALPCPGGLPHC
ncbi:hypothetical protein C8R47DRAFT_1327767 [Mycena vitilis]|nr:hypothetical protein C8R47DRAFT_1327767 [Mycena vitilis]